MPYTKSVAAILNQGQFNVDATLEDLKDNPTLAASVMHASIELAAARAFCPNPLAESVLPTIPLRR